MATPLGVLIYRNMSFRFLFVEQIKRQNSNHVTWSTESGVLKNIFFSLDDCAMTALSYIITRIQVNSPQIRSRWFGSHMELLYMHRRTQGALPKRKWRKTATHFDAILAEFQAPGLVPHLPCHRSNRRHWKKKARIHGLKITIQESGTAYSGNCFWCVSLGRQHEIKVSKVPKEFGSVVVVVVVVICVFPFVVCFCRFVVCAVVAAAAAVPKTFPVLSSSDFSRFKSRERRPTREMFLREYLRRVVVWMLYALNDRQQPLALVRFETTAERRLSVLQRKCWSRFNFF